jgi:hypothetical protein
MMRAGECSALAMPALRTNENESGLWPTPRASANENRQTALTPSQIAGTHGLSLCAVVNTPAMWPTVRASDGERGGRGDLIQAVRGNPNSHYKLWPTPVANDGEKRGNFDLTNPRNGLAAAAKLWPTPTVQDSENNGAPSQMERNTKPLNAEVGGSLNPTWVEWLMGWPLGWTDCAASATDRFRTPWFSLGLRYVEGLKNDAKS